MLKILELSDVHLFHPNTPTFNILSELYSIFADRQENRDLDLIIFAGDVWHRLVNLPDADVFPVKMFIVAFLRFCAKHDIVVLITEGTPSHDWKQSQLFVDLNKSFNIGAELYYVSDLRVLRIEKLGIDVLCIPDEHRPTTEETWTCVLQALAEKNLKQVDYTVMHGMFPHQMAKNLHSRLQLHDPERYLSITRKYIFIGHVHTQSQFDRILAAGSTSRLAFGEEGDKGYYRVIVNDDGEDQITFCVNSAAMKYITISCMGLDESQVVEKVEKTLKRLPLGSFIRLRAKRHDAAIPLLSYFRKTYTMFSWADPKVEKEKENKDPVLVDNRTELLRTNITRDNIVDLSAPRLRDKHPTVAERSIVLLRELVDEY